MEIVGKTRIEMENPSRVIVITRDGKVLRGLKNLERDYVIAVAFTGEGVLVSINSK